MAFRKGMNAVVIGATGGIGAALVRALAADGHAVHALSRSAADPKLAGVTPGSIDLLDEASIAAAAERIPAPDLVIVATGLLHDAAQRPERSLTELDPTHLARSFAVNAIGPALVAKHFLPRLPRDGRAIFAALSARVGSIGDNRLGGWHGYRASKAALNMLIRTLAIGQARSHPDTIVVGLHPGTVATDLSAPFQRNVTPEKLFTPDQSAAHLLAVIAGLAPEHSGACLAWDGSVITP